VKPAAGEAIAVPIFDSLSMVFRHIIFQSMALYPWRALDREAVSPAIWLFDLNSSNQG
jgi:hypothetical protein